MPDYSETIKDRQLLFVGHRLVNHSGNINLAMVASQNERIAVRHFREDAARHSDARDTAP